MTRNSILLITVTAVMASSVWGCRGAEASTILRASCMEGNQVVYREDIPSDAPEERRAQIIARNPNALCVFLEQQGSTEIGLPRPSGNIPSSGAGRLPDALIAAAAGKTTIPDAELSAALSAIAGHEGSQPFTYPPGKPGSQGVQAGNMTGSSKSRDGVVALTLGVYKGMPLAEVMMHWRQMSEGSRLLSRMTPTITTADDVTMLSVEGVTDDEAGSLCLEAEERGVGCLAVY